MSILERIKSIVHKDLARYIGPVEIDDDTLFFGGGLDLDSLASIEFISLLEKEFKIEFDESDLAEERLRSPRVIAELLQKYLAGSPQ